MNDILDSKKILILGFGREGMSTYKFIRSALPSLQLTIADRKKVNELDIKFKDIIKNDKLLFYNGGKSYLQRLTDFDLIVKTPGVPYKLNEITEAKKKGVKFTSQTNIFLQKYRDKVIGVTGTKGKSTTTSLIYQILKSSGVKCELIGNIGIPVLEYYDTGDAVDYFVFEMSSHQLFDTETSPHIALFLNIFPEHLDYYKDYEEYILAKGNITKYQNKNDIFIYNGNFNKIENIAKTTLATKLNFDSYKLPEIKTSLMGIHNLNNIKAAFLAAKQIGIKTVDINKAITRFNPLEGRLEKVGEYRGISFVNDTLATIPEATIAAVDSFPNQKISLILGGFDRGIDFSAMAKEITNRKNVSKIILIGQTGSRINKELHNANYQGEIYDLGTSSMTDVVKKSVEISIPNSVVLLSPAATSFDMFKDYKDRGDQFRETVRNLK